MSDKCGPISESRDPSQNHAVGIREQTHAERNAVAACNGRGGGVQVTELDDGAHGSVFEARDIDKGKDLPEGAKHALHNCSGSTRSKLDGLRGEGDDVD